MDKSIEKLSFDRFFGTFPKITSLNDVQEIYKKIYSTKPYYVNYNLIDLFGCAILGIPSVLYFYLFNNKLILIEGFCVSICSILADGLQMSEWINLDRKIAFINLILWIYLGLTQVHKMSIIFIVFQVILFIISVLSQQLALFFFYYTKQPNIAIQFQRFWHLGATVTMLNILQHIYYY